MRQTDIETLVESMIFGKQVVQGKLMEGGDYFKGKCELELISEVMNSP